MVKNDKGESVPHMTMGCRMCIDYRKLNAAKKNDNFFLPFIDQMLDKLAGHQYYCFLDGLSDYYQVAIALDNQENIHFSSSFETHEYMRISFGLCNVPRAF